MKILFYCPQTSDGIGNRVDEVIGRLVSRNEIETMDSFEDLRARLRRRIGDLSLAVLLAPTMEHFRHVLALGSLLEDTRSILILPNRKPQTMAEALKLRPRFLTFTDSNFSDLAEVMEKMLQIGCTGRRRAGET